MNWRAQLDKVVALNPFDTVESLQALINLNSIIPQEAQGEYYNYIGIAFSNPKNPQYSEIAASVWFQKAAEAGSGPAAINLARHYLSGTYGSVDEAKGTHWLEVAHKLGNPMASTILLKLKQRDGRFNSDPKFADAAREAVERDASQGLAPAMFQVAIDKARTDPSITVQYFEKLTAGKIQGRLGGDLQIKAAFHLGLRYFLGFDVKEDWSKARHYLNRVIADAAGGGEMDPHRNHATGLLKAMGHLKTGAPAIAKVVHDIYTKKASGEGLFYDIYDKDASVSEELAERVDAALILDQEEKHGLWDWIRILAAIDVRLMGGRLRTMTENHNAAYGPFYNEMRPTCLPRLGVLRHGGLSHGVGEIVQIKGTSKGTIEFQCREPWTNIGPLLGPEDINVALALVFSGEQPLIASVTVDGLVSPTARVRSP